MCRELITEALLPLPSADLGEGAPDMMQQQVIADAFIIKVLGSLCKMGDLHSAGVTSIELLERSRQPLPELDGLYLARPTQENIERILADFKASSEPQHRQVTLAFVRPLQEKLMEALVECPALVQRVNHLVEVPLSFVHIQDRGFHFGMLDELVQFLAAPPGSLIKEIAGRLVDVCRCLQDFNPSVRLGGTEMCNQFGQFFLADLENAKPVGAKPSDIPTTVLVLDRSFDLAAPLVHEYTYEAAAMDVLDGTVIDVDKWSAKPAEKEALLSDSDAVWEMLKNTHIDEAMARTQAEVDALSHREQGRDKADVSIKDLMAQLRGSPQFKEQVEQLDLHMNLLQQTIRKLNEERLFEEYEKGDTLGLLEQRIACGVDENGKDVKPAQFVESLAKVFTRFDFLTSTAKLRLLMLLFACVSNVADNVQQRLLDQAKLEDEDREACLRFVAQLREVPDKQRYHHGKGALHNVTKDSHARYKRLAREDGRYQLSRFEPRLKLLLEQLAGRKLSQDFFPSYGASGQVAGGSHFFAASGGSGAKSNSWAFTEDSTGGPSVVVPVTQRILVFIIGGVTFSELRSAAEVSKELRDTEICVGGTCLLTPKRFLESYRPSVARARTKNLDRENTGEVRISIGEPQANVPMSKASSVRAGLLS
eukprot:CAMPEP_0178403624 /NCGR_PEP_ID=MMETSP0689_2-20121128/17465_1 /TAXON_ID=160604 /ORGANISM="Amphidinium massartii, Strain CS-259" /LENGTH=649 /DNA_ID=CAMNT_0020024585 /DNA_START=95 /DNA_END=2044 /DNA_ORIENTATION=+